MTAAEARKIIKYCSEEKETPETRLDHLFCETFETNHPAMQDYALLKINWKKRLSALENEIEGWKHSYKLLDERREELQKQLALADEKVGHEDRKE